MIYKYKIWGVSVQSDRELDFNESKLMIALVEAKSYIEQYGINTVLFKVIDNKVLAYPDNNHFDQLIDLQKQDNKNAVGYVEIEI